MTVDERRRSELFQATARVLGEEHAETMFDLLPPPSTDIATRADVEALGAEMEQRLSAIEGRIDAMDQRLVGQRDYLDARFDAMDQRLTDERNSRDARFDAMDQRLTDERNSRDERFDAMDQRLVGQRDYLDARIDGLRDELLAAFRGELVTAVAGQSRALIIAVAVVVFGIGGLAVTIAQLL